MFPTKEDIFHCSIKALIQNSDGHILVLRHSSVKPHLTGRWDLPGGRMDRGETVHQALRRELFEELGLTDITVDKHCLMAFAPTRINLASGDVGLIMSIFNCAIGQEDILTLSIEHELFEWVEPREAAHRLEKYFPEELITLLHSFADARL